MADIHLPEQVSYWPPAPGWWVLAALLLALVIYGIWRMQKRWQLQRRYQNAIRELDKCRAQLEAKGGADGNTMDERLVYVNEVNSVLRRVALIHFDQSTVAGLSGQAWVAFLQQHDRTGRLTPDLANALAEGRFAPRCDVDTAALHIMARDWIKNLYMTRIKKSSDTATPTRATADHHA